MTSPLDELRTALATIDRESAEATPGPWWTGAHDGFSFTVEGPEADSHPVAQRLIRPDSAVIVGAVAAYRGVVRDIIADAIERYPTQEKYGETGYAHDALRLARGINARTEGAS